MTGEISSDVVIITASNSSGEIMHQAAEMSRKRGRIILLGVVGLKLRRDDWSCKGKMDRSRSQTSGLMIIAKELRRREIP